MKLKGLLILVWLVLLILQPVLLCWMLIMIALNTKRALSMVLAYDRLGNAAFGQGDRETISSWSGRKGGWREQAIDWLFRHLTGELNHCDNHREIQCKN